MVQHAGPAGKGAARDQPSRVPCPDDHAILGPWNPGPRPDSQATVTTTA